MQPHLSELFTTEIEQFNQAISKYGRIQPGFSLSIKTKWRNLFGIEEDILMIGRAGWPNLQLSRPENWACLRLSNLYGLLDQPKFEAKDLNEALSNCRAYYDSAQSSSVALLHAAVQSKWVCFCQPFDLLAASCLPNALTIIQNWFGKAVLILPFEPDLHRLSRQIFTHSDPGSEFILLNRGLLTAAADLKDIQTKLDDLLEKVSPGMNTLEVNPQIDERQSPESVFLPAIRAAICAQRGRPLVLHLDDSAEMRAFINLPVSSQVTESGVPFPGFSAHTGLPTILSNEADSIPTLPPESKTGMSVILRPGTGSITAGNSIVDAIQTGALFQTAALAMSAASRMVKVQTLNPDALQEAENWETMNFPTPQPYSGEVALVTGSASGIGKAVVEALLRRGCAVVGVDINPSICTTFDHPCFHGIRCDVFDEAAICETMRLVGRRFGGLDILVLNAGLFPGGCNIEKLTLTEFTKVININFVSNMVILREAFPMLRLAPRYGRVVIVGSKNMRAPGPGAAAYSTSKAALTQLARVAALEWGSERIRVNVIHPDSVFDTALYTEEVLQARASHYGMTVEQYKKRNLLKTEITSHDVAELAAEMCGPLFRHMTGGQIQFDGGNDRTI